MKESHLDLQGKRPTGSRPSGSRPGGSSKIVIDGFGGDNAPVETVLGAVEALSVNRGLEIVITGDETKIKKILTDNNIPENPRLTIFHAPETVTNGDDPISAVKRKKNSSLVAGLQLVAEGKGDAFVSGGNTGAVLTGATLIIKRIRGVKRAALCPEIPAVNGLAVIIDVGANAECKPEFLPQFAHMGAIYAKEILGIKNPKAGLINIGVEEHKGTGTVADAYRLLEKDENINFVGNIEARDILKGYADVLVSDGWTGNIALKSIEGTASVLMSMLKDVFYESALTKTAALFLKKGLQNFKKRFDHTEAGGAPLLGLNAPVIKAHGSSNRKNFKNAILFASEFCEKDICKIINNSINKT
jgi:glycerol-3-phosphate acyltransferase PlsX